MNCFLYVVLLLLFVTVNATFWYENDDFEQVMDPYKSSLSQDYLRALSIFKRKLQLLGFYPLVLDEDGLEYMSMEPYFIDDDDDDQVYKLLKQMKKEKKARKKLQKKKSKKAKKVTDPPVTTTQQTTRNKNDILPPVTTTTTVQPISNIVYFWPSAITTIVHPGQGEGTSTYKQSFDAGFGINDSSEENSSEADSNEQAPKNEKQKTGKMNYQTSFTFERKFDDGDTQIRANRNQTLTSSTTTTTPYPLITVFPDPEGIIDQQEIVNKISDNGQGNITKSIISVEDQDHVDRTTNDSTTVQNNVIETDTMIHVTDQVYEGSQSHSQDTKIPEEKVPSESSTNVIPDITSIAPIDVATESLAYSTEPSQTIPSGALQFFHETLPDELHIPSGLPDLSEIVDNFPVSISPDPHVSDPVTEIAENITNIDGDRETDTQHGHSAVLLNEKATAVGATPQPLNEHLTPPKSNDEEHLTPPKSTEVEHLTPPKSTDNGTIYTELELTIPTNQITNESEGYVYAIDPKITRPIKFFDVVEGLESRTLTDKPEVAAVAVDAKNGRRSDVPVETDDANEEDTTDNLAYNLTNDNLLEQSKVVVENTSAETSTQSPLNITNYDNSDQLDGEIIPLIPIIIKQMKQGDVSSEEMEILKNSFGPFWPFIVEEASRESDSSEEMNPMLSELLNSVNRKIVKREATWTRPIYGRRIYVDDDDDFELVPLRSYYRRHRRPYRRYYQKK